VPGSAETGAETGIPPPPDIGDIMPPSQHGSQTGPHGSQTGPQGAAIGGGQASPRRPQGERNSMNEGRRQLPKLPKQLLHPGAAVRAASASARQTNRDMTNVSNEREVGEVREGCGVVADATGTLPHGFRRGGSPAAAGRRLPRRDAGRSGCADSLARAYSLRQRFQPDCMLEFDGDGEVPLSSVAAAASRLL